MATPAAFAPTGNTVTFTAGTSVPAGVQAVTSGSGLGSQNYLVTNAGNVTVFLGVGSTNAIATTNAGNVTTTGPSIPILPSLSGVLTFGPNAWFTGYAASNAVVYITPGDGL